MKKIFVYIGSKNPHSYTEKVVVLLIKKIEEYLSEEVESIVRTPNNSKVNECLGCNKCFLEGLCPQKDDMEKIKQEMLSSNLIIFASPVYLHSISGSLKIFIDRISYWSHLFALSGSHSVSINTSTSSGNQFLEDYMKKALSLFGTSHITDISICQAGLSDTALNSIITASAKKIVSIMKNNSHPISSLQEIYFTSFKNLAENKKLFPAELNYWIQCEMIKYNNYYSFFAQKYNQKNSYNL